MTANDPSMGGQSSTGGKTSKPSGSGGRDGSQMGVAGEGGTESQGNEWPPEQGLPFGTLDELLAAGCQIAVERDGNDVADQRWGYEYDSSGQLVGEWVYDGAVDLVTKTRFDEDGQPLVRCSPVECEQFIYGTTPEGEQIVEVVVHPSEPLVFPPNSQQHENDLWPEFWENTRQAASWTYDLDGRLLRVETKYVAQDSSGAKIVSLELEYAPDGQLENAWIDIDRGFDDQSPVNVSFHVNGRPSYAVSDYGSRSCNELGWSTDEVTCEDGECWGKNETSYSIEDGRVVKAVTDVWRESYDEFGGGPGAPDAQIASKMTYSEDGYSVTIMNTFDDDSPEESREFLLEPELVETELDSLGNTKVRRSAHELDRTWGLVETYTYSGSGACRSGNDPHLERGPRVRVEVPKSRCDLFTEW